jgi:hypothetical protein
MAPSLISDLVQKYDENENSYTVSTSKQDAASGRVSKPLLESLCWDIINREGSAEA